MARVSCISPVRNKNTSVQPVGHYGIRLRHSSSLLYAICTQSYSTPISFIQNHNYIAGYQSTTRE